MTLRAVKFATYTDNNGKTYLGEKDVQDILKDYGVGDAMVDRDIKNTKIYVIIYVPKAYSWKNGGVTEKDIGKIKSITKRYGNKVKRALKSYAADQGRDLWKENVDMAINEALDALDRLDLNQTNDSLPDLVKNNNMPYPVAYGDSPFFFRMPVVLMPHTGVYKDPKTGRNVIDWTGWDEIIDQTEKIIDHADKLQRMKPQSTNGARYEQHKDWMYNTQKRFDKLLSQKLPFNVKENGDYQTMMHYFDEFMNMVDNIIKAEESGDTATLTKNKEQTTAVSMNIYKYAKNLLDALLAAKEDPDSWKSIAIRSMIRFMVDYDAITPNTMKWLIRNTKESRHKAMVKLANTYYWSSNRFMTKDILERTLYRT